MNVKIALEFACASVARNWYWCWCYWGYNSKSLKFYTYQIKWNAECVNWSIIQSILANQCNCKFAHVQKCNWIQVCNSQSISLEIQHSIVKYIVKFRSYLWKWIEVLLFLYGNKIRACPTERKFPTEQFNGMTNMQSHELTALVSLTINLYK